MESIQKICELQLRYPFGIARGTSTTARTVLFRLGDLGQGEAGLVRYKGHTPEGFLPVLADLAKDITPENIDDIEGHDARARAKYPDQSGAVSGLNLALWDARGRRENKPVHELVGAKKSTNLTTYTIGIAENATMAERAAEAAHMPFLKIKLGRDAETDHDAMKRIRKAAPNAVLRVDANAGWSYETARNLIPKLEALGVEFFEQPLAIGNIEETAKLTEEFDIPIVVDEDAQDVKSLDALRGKVSGINIKLTKCGGISEALKMIDYARNEGWIILIGCMLETRLGLGAASHLASLVDYMDVDAHMLTTDDPFPPGSLKEFSPKLPLSDGPGLGLPFIDF